MPPTNRNPFAERTNLQSWLVQPKTKRPLDDIDDAHSRKRVKLSPDYSSDGSYESDSDAETLPPRRRVRHPCAANPRLPFVSTLPVLQSLVSSNKSDVFRCQSVLENSFLTPPYACSYSHSARSGGAPLLAVATEQGTVYVINTSKRNEWDPEPVYTTLQPHNNGIFDVKWNGDDTLLATGSGDRSARVSDLQTCLPIHTLGHNSTIKCLSWDTVHRDLLTTGGRDGTISVWDLRAHEDVGSNGKRKAPKGKHASVPRTVTSLVYSDTNPHQLISSGSSDGILRCWDLRVSKKGKSPVCLLSSPVDPYPSLVMGSGPTTGLIFGLGSDSRIHTYARDSLLVCGNSFTHERLQTNFYVKLAASPCGRWLATGGTGHCGAFAFDVSNATRGSGVGTGVELKGYSGDVGGIDWASNGLLSTCCDDGTVRTWRPDAAQNRAAGEEEQWNWCRA
ncbi:WD40 repeat-like protein [Roridomyces roridus]|uniref:WD40 repeat-like protein n=1 Tax=Roridomyces roridus TaxID=1738132 RepID=A0AAD7FUE6_9AGAR|nr:WD40 repeat-like protein [Roridomyces roridus]